MKARLSASRLPLPSRVSSPPPLPAPPPLVIDGKGKKKSSRRQSGLLTVDTARPPSPAFGSPIRKLAEEAQLEEDEEDEVIITDEMSVDAELEAALRRGKKAKSKEREREVDRDVVESSRPKERKRRRDEEEASTSTTTSTSNTEGGKKLKDVTNSPRRHSTLPSLDTNGSGMCSTLLTVHTFLI
jgi:hypothetical protein